MNGWTIITISSGISQRKVYGGWNVSRLNLNVRGTTVISNRPNE